MDMNLILLIVLVVLIVWMFFSSRRRQQKLREEQAMKAERMVPGARVMTRSGLFGTIVEYDKDDLSRPARVEIAPGVVVELHTQAVDLAPEETAEAVADEEPADEALPESETAFASESTVDDRQGGYTVNGVETDELPGSGTSDKGDDKKS